MRIFILLLFTFLCLKSNAQNGKTYKALIGQSCKEMADGGCMIYTNQILKFRKDSVEISEFIKAHCSSKEKEKNYENTNNDLTKIYKWSLSNSKVTIEDYNENGILVLEENKLIGKRNIEFIEVNN